jgi:hypothetical protein
MAVSSGVRAMFRNRNGIGIQAAREKGRGASRRAIADTPPT